MGEVAVSMLPKRDDDSPGAALRHISHKLATLADRLDSKQSITQSALSVAIAERDDLLLQIWAEAEFAARRKRSDWLPVHLLGEPGWDILLNLYLQTARRKRVSIASTCEAAAVPQSTALRWLGSLETEGLIRRVLAGHDERGHVIELTDAGMVAMARWLRYRAALPM